MKALNPALADHLAGEATTLCRCWRLTRRDGLVLGFTDHDRDLEFDGTLFVAQSGLNASEADQRLGLAAASQEIIGALLSERITEADIRADRYDGAQVETFLVNWNDVEERVLERASLIGEIMREDGAYRAELRSAAAALDQTQGRRFTRSCDAELGDARCGVNLAGPAWSANATVASVGGDLVIRLAGLSGFAADHFTGGRLTFLTGANSAMAVEIASHGVDAGGVSISLWKPPAFPVEAGDEVKVEAGCDKRFPTCRDRFSNRLNFRGFPHIPGNDFALGYAGRFDVFDGGALVP
jgi:uncharacterized phage protein (TIGR02218 family)